MATSTMTKPASAGGRGNATVANEGCNLRPDGTLEMLEPLLCH